MTSAHPPADLRQRFIDDYLLYLMARASHVVSDEFHEQLRRRRISVPVWRVLASLVGSPGRPSPAWPRSACCSSRR
ncbi:hypothetical protein ACFQU2_30300 [Siccirubricoccus deserti]